jgi:hypothetical protein
VCDAKRARQLLLQAKKLHEAPKKHELYLQAMLGGGNTKSKAVSKERFRKALDAGWFAIRDTKAYRKRIFSKLQLRQASIFCAR